MLRMEENFLKNPPTYEELDLMLTESNTWEETMWIKSKDIPIMSGKKGCFFGIPDEYDSLPYLRCPSFSESKKMPIWMKELLLDPINNHFGTNLNLIKVQKYIKGQCGIAPHTDKIIDLLPDSSIFILRINKETDKTRSLFFRDKENECKIIEIPIKSNSLLEISSNINKRFVHYVTEDEKDCTDECISFVFRDCRTFMNSGSKIKYGLGAKHKTYKDRIISNEDPVDMRDNYIYQDIIAMYKFENKTNLLNYDTKEIFEKVIHKTI